ncbi:hypothetical protein MNB_SUP05-SYMBIONT-7-794 [hydrothermal vent metagenome]|uniref:Uncharacterized protein n=1 Tax=hydrothermal vent metagenome TaxID=652676 RepID=A0A1W1E4L4_9ZZZZ
MTSKHPTPNTHITHSNQPIENPSVLKTFLNIHIANLNQHATNLNQLLEKLFLLVSFLNKEKTFLFKHCNPATKAFYFFNHNLIFYSIKAIRNI